MKFLTATIITLSCLLFFTLYLLTSSTAQEHDEVSGSVENGYRILLVPANSKTSNFTVYRGDYIKFKTDAVDGDVQLTIESLSVNEKINADPAASPYFKMKKVGVYPYSLGDISGTIDVVEYDKPQYKALTATETAQLIENISPLILDVRSRGEFSGGHLENAVNIPVQEIQQRYQELTDYTNENILIYCATGNRSTVAAKILIDNGFTRIYNMRSGIYVWAKEGNPIVK